MKLLLLSLLLSYQLRADMFGGDVSVLLQIAMTTIKQLNEMESLVSNTKKYTEKIQHYNEMLSDKMLFAKQIAHKLERLKSLNTNPKDLGDINRLLFSLKMQIRDLETVAKSTLTDINESQGIQKDAAKLDSQADKFKGISDNQLSLAKRVEKNVSINKAAALSSAYNLEVNTHSLQVQTQNLHQNATQTEYIAKKYLEDKIKENDVHEFFLGKRDKETTHELY